MGLYGESLWSGCEIDGARPRHGPKLPFCPFSIQHFLISFFLINF